MPGMPSNDQPGMGIQPRYTIEMIDTNDGMTDPSNLHELRGLHERA